MSLISENSGVIYQTVTSSCSPQNPTPLLATNVCLLDLYKASSLNAFTHLLTHFSFSLSTWQSESKYQLRVIMRLTSVAAVLSMSKHLEAFLRNGKVPELTQGSEQRICTASWFWLRGTICIYHAYRTVIFQSSKVIQHFPG